MHFRYPVQIAVREDRMEHRTSATSILESVELLIAMGEGAKDLRPNCLKLLICLKHLKRLLENYDSSSSMAVEAIELLENALGEAKILLETSGSKIYRVWHCHPLVSKFGDVTSKIERAVVKLFLPTSEGPCWAQSQLGNCLLQLKRTRYFVDISDERLADEIETLLAEHRNGRDIALQKLHKLASKLDIRCKKTLAKELEALQKEEGFASTQQGKEQISDLVSLLAPLQVKASEPKQKILGVWGLSIPADFRCPLSLELMVHPVIVASGQTYERAYIQKWLDQGNNTCPKTRQVLLHDNLIPNYTVKALITSWCLANNIALPDRDSEEVSPKVKFRSHNSSVSDAGHGNHPRSMPTVGALSFKISDVDTRHENGGAIDGFKGAYSSNEEGTSSCLCSGSSSSDDARRADYSVDNLERATRSVRGHRFLGRSQSTQAPAVYSKELDSHRRYSFEEKMISTYSRNLHSTEQILPARILNLVEELHSESTETQKYAVAQLRVLAKNDMQNRILIADAGAIRLLIDFLDDPDPETQENAVTALLNLSINDNNKAEIALAGAIDPLVRVLKVGTPEAMENAAATLFSLSIVEDNRAAIGDAGAISPLVDLLAHGSPRGKKDAATALFNLSIRHDNKARIVQAGAVRPLVELMGEPATGMVDKAVAILANLATIPEGRVAIGEEGGIIALVEVVEAGSPRGRENAAAALLHLCTNSNKHRAMVLQEGAVPPLHALSQTGTPRAKEKALALLRHFREQRQSRLGFKDRYL